MRPAFLLLLSIAIPAEAQLLDSIALFASEPPRVVTSVGMRGGFVANRSARFAGLRLGLEHAGRFQYGLGYAVLWSAIERGITPVPGLETDARLRVGYAGPYVDYAFFQRGPWEVRQQLAIGYGVARETYPGADGRRRELYRTGILVYEPVMTVQYRLVRYAALGAGWGFRLVGHTRQRTSYSLTAPIYTFGLRVFFGEILNDLRGEDR